jgi:diacylglycerol kinase (ATP)
MKICPEAEIDDGLLDVTVLLPVGKVEFVRVFPRVYKGTHVTHPAVLRRRVREITLRAPGQTAYADGERLTDLPVTATCVPGALQVLVP